MVVERVAQVVGDALRYAGGQRALQVGEQRAQRRDADDEQRAEQDRLHPAGQDAAVDDLLREPGHRQVAGRSGQQTDQAGGRAPPVRPQVAQAARQSAQRRAAGLPDAGTGAARAVPRRAVPRRPA